VLWGQPAALAAAALWAGFAQTGIVIVYLAVTALTLLSSAAPLRTARLARAWRLLTALLLIVLCVRHVLGQGVGGDPVAWLVDAALVGTALLLCLRQRNAG
jgi:hypothetical protein